MKKYHKDEEMNFIMANIRYWQDEKAKRAKEIGVYEDMKEISDGVYIRNGYEKVLDVFVSESHISVYPKKQEKEEFPELEEERKRLNDKGIDWPNNKKVDYNEDDTNVFTW